MTYGSAKVLPLAATLITLLSFSGCGGDGPTSGFVSIKEARAYFEVLYGSVETCEGRSKMRFFEWQLAGEPEEKVWQFVLCRIGDPKGPFASEAGVVYGDVLSYGIP